MKSSFCYFGQSSRGRMVSMGVETKRNGLTYSYSNSGRKEVLRREIQKTPSRNIYARRWENLPIYAHIEKHALYYSPLRMFVEPNNNNFPVLTDWQKYIESHYI